MSKRMELDGASLAIVMKAFELGRRQRLKSHEAKLRMELIESSMSGTSQTKDREAIKVSQDPAGALEEIAGGISGKL